MKTTLLIRSVIIFCLITCFSCSKDSVDEERFTGTMQAKINGELIVFESASGYGFFDLGKRCSDPFHQISGVNGFGAFSPGDYANAPPDGQLIILNFHPSDGVGTHNLSGEYLTYSDWIPPINKNIESYYQYHFCSETQTHHVEEGSVTITSTANNRYKGTFHFTATYGCGDNIVVITEGIFEINQKNPLTCD